MVLQHVPLKWISLPVFLYGHILMVTFWVLFRILQPCFQNRCSRVMIATLLHHLFFLWALLGTEVAYFQTLFSSSGSPLFHFHVNCIELFYLWACCAEMGLSIVWAAPMCRFPLMLCSPHHTHRCWLLNCALSSRFVPLLFTPEDRTVLSHLTSGRFSISPPS